MRLFLAISIAIILGGGTLWAVFWREGGEQSTQLSADNPLLLPNPDPTIDTYISGRYGFRVEFPRGPTVTVGDEGGGAQTISFEDSVEEWGFQVFVVPYSGAEITEARLKKDVPGARANEEKIVVDTAQGIAFYSQDPTLGVLREAWFVHEGYLFEVTAPQPFEARLLEVLKTWRFL